MKCSECETEIPKDMNFCKKWGKELSKPQVSGKFSKSSETSKYPESKGFNTKLLILFIVAVGAIGIYNLAHANVVAAESIEPVKYPTMNVVVSGSMEPVLYRGDVVIVDNPSNIQVGDIVVYKATWFPDPVIHRVITIEKTSNGNLFELKGDNNPVPDPYLVKPDKIVSKVITVNGHPLVIPKIGYITIGLRELMGQNI